jgi:hypothetical protein
MRNFFLIKHHPRGLKEVYQENSRPKRNLPDTRTIVQSLPNVKCRVVFWFFPLRRWCRCGPETAPPSGPCPAALAGCLRRLALARGSPRVPVRRRWLPVARGATGTPWQAPRQGMRADPSISERGPGGTARGGRTRLVEKAV